MNLAHSYSSCTQTARVSNANSNELRKERHELFDKLKDQEGAILRAQEQLESLERLLINPLAAANAMVYFQLRYLWRVGAQKIE